MNIFKIKVPNCFNKGSFDLKNKEKRVSSAKKNKIGRYQENLKNNEDFDILRKSKTFESEDFTSNQYSSFKLMPALFPADNYTLLYGIVIESTSKETLEKIMFDAIDQKILLSAMDKFDHAYRLEMLSRVAGFEFLNISDSGETIVIPVESTSEPATDVGNKNSKRNHLKTTKPLSILHTKKSESDLEVIASIGATIVTDTGVKVISSSKQSSGVYVGALEVKNSTMNGFLKFYFDQDLQKATNDLLNDENVRSVSIELCT